jgi:hypothetical protein
MSCEDCGNPVEAGVAPTGLFRPVEGSLPDRIWDATKQRWVRRPGAAKAGGRRYREYRLCRRCRGTALRERSAKGGTVMENGVKRSLRTRERVEPKKGGRPRLLSYDELAVLHRIYEQRGLSIGELARQLAATRDKGTESGYYQSILYGWRNLGYQLRPKGEQIGISRFGTDGTKSKPQLRRCRGRVTRGERAGKRCLLYAERGRDHCWDHREQADEEAA